VLACAVVAVVLGFSGWPLGDSVVVAAVMVQYLNEIRRN
jgi:hypothetical protein